MVKQMDLLSIPTSSIPNTVLNDNIPRFDANNSECLGRRDIIFMDYIYFLLISYSNVGTIKWLIMARVMGQATKYISSFLEFTYCWWQGSLFVRKHKKKIIQRNAKIRFQFQKQVCEPPEENTNSLNSDK